MYTLWQSHLSCGSQLKQLYHLDEFSFRQVVHLIQSFVSHFLGIDWHDATRCHPHQWDLTPQEWSLIRRRRFAAISTYFNFFTTCLILLAYNDYVSITLVRNGSASGLANATLQQQKSYYVNVKIYVIKLLVYKPQLYHLDISFPNFFILHIDHISITIPWIRPL